MRERVKEREGVVVSARMTKTVVVRVQRLVPHPLYGKRIRVNERYKAHDEKGECREGDRVLLIESRPLSKDKRWRISRILKRAAG
jgi:small subunit ribosomal protein S17